MKIFYIKKDELLKKVSKDELEQYSDGKKYKSENKYLEHLMGLYLTKNVAQKCYGIKDTTIVSKDDKPKFKSVPLHFSISHSKNIVLVGFCENDIGTDVEFMAQRDFGAILDYYHETKVKGEKEPFYRFWTNYEAGIKLGEHINSSISTIIEKDYMMTVVSSKPIVSDLRITNYLQ